MHGQTIGWLSTTQDCYFDMPLHTSLQPCSNWSTIYSWQHSLRLSTPKTSTANPSKKPAQYQHSANTTGHNNLFAHQSKHWAPLTADLPYLKPCPEPSLALPSLALPESVCSSPSQPQKQAPHKIHVSAKPSTYSSICLY